MSSPREKRQVVRAINACIAELPSGELAETCIALLAHTTYQSLRDNLLVALAGIGGKPEEHSEEQAAAVAKRDADLNLIRERKRAKTAGEPGANLAVQSTSLEEAPHGHA